MLVEIEQGLKRAYSSEEPTRLGLHSAEVASIAFTASYFAEVASIAFTASYLAMEVHFHLIAF